MSTEQALYSTKTLHGLPSKSSFFQVDVKNDWALLAEAIVGSCPQPSAQLDQLILLLESHGVVVHQVPASQTKTPAAIRSHFVSEPSSPDANVASAVKENSSPFPPFKAANRPSPLLFAQNAALVYGTRVIEAPPLAHRLSSQETQSPYGAEQSDAVSHANALFDILQNAGAEVIRWPGASASGERKAPEGQLIDVGQGPDGRDKEEEGPLFSPSDIIILSPTLLITRLSPFTNNKGLEYLWSVLSRPARENRTSLDNTSGDSPAHLPGPKPSLVDPPPTPPTTTLLVSITESDTLTVNSPNPAVLRSPRTPTFAAAQAALPKPAPAGYTPLSRALVPIDGRVMLYDPALVAEGEARRLKSVIDRVQEGAGGGGLDAGGLDTMKPSKRDSVMSYGTFGSLNRSDDEGWQFISVEGLHTTSILVVSPELAFLSAAPSSSPSTSPVQTSSVSSPRTPSFPRAFSAPNRESLTKVTQVLGSFGVRAVPLPFTDLNDLGGGVRDAILVLRRESALGVSEAGDAGADQEGPGWDRQGEEEQEGCWDAVFAPLVSCLCGLLAGGGSPGADAASE